MNVVFDIEANGLTPTHIWVIVAKDIDTGERHVFRQPTEDDTERRRFIAFASDVKRWIGHNCLGYDLPVLRDLLGISFSFSFDAVVDTLIVSKLIDYPRQGHSIEHYGEEFGIEKDKYNDWTKYSVELENRCIRDVDICEKVYLKYVRYITHPDHAPSLDCEHRFQEVCNNLTDKGFFFNKDKGVNLLLKVQDSLRVLDNDILDTFVPKLKVIRTVTPKETKYGTISLSSIPKEMRKDIADLTIGAPFSYCHWHAFNPSSHRQIVDVLNEAGWRPLDKTQTHIDTERKINRKKYSRKPEDKLDIDNLSVKLDTLRHTGWKVNEQNLETLPPSAPKSARLLAKRILLESRRRTLTEWLGLVTATDCRIHGKFYGIGAWTHRMAHQSPNTANITNSVKVSDGTPVLLGKELRALWSTPRNRLLVGVDAEAIQLRVFAHMIDDPVLTDAIVNGKKSEGTDPHSLNKKYFGSYCKTRNAAKHSLYAMFFGGGPNKIAEIMSCTREQAIEAIDSLSEKYPGLRKLQNEVFPKDAARGYFIGLDGRKVRIPGDAVGQRKHLCMSGYLQNGESVLMKKATLRFVSLLPEDCFLVNFVHDEWQTEIPNSMEIGLRVASLQADSLRIVGEELGLRCPLAGSYFNDDLKDYTIAKDWSHTH